LPHVFADDVGLFIPASPAAFQTLWRCLEIYELASGAKLNLQKSVAIPIAAEPTPDWLQATGCIIAEPGVVYKYLGAPFGLKLTPLIIQNFCLDKLTKKLAQLSSLHLSYTGRIHIVKQILMAIPTYHLMYAQLPLQSSKKLQTLCLEYLWGRSKRGNRKLAFISWQRLTNSKKHGGNAIKDIDAQSKALLAR
jgi:hypothetical protein